MVVELWLHIGVSWLLQNGRLRLSEGDKRPTALLEGM